MINKLKNHILKAYPQPHQFPLNAPLSYLDTLQSNPGALEGVCNGCGPTGWKFDIIPDTILGVGVSEACNIHDYEYHYGVDELDRKRADENFYNNLIKIVKNHGGPPLLAGLLFQWRKRRVRKYYRAVSKFGKKAFESGKS